MKGKVAIKKAAQISSLDQITDLLKDHTSNLGGARTIVAIAGPPGVGKSTFSQNLMLELTRNHPNFAAILPMDGYHYDDIYLNEKNWRPRKGAPHTFDVGGLQNTLMRLRANEEPDIAVPVFDRKLEIARAGARLISNQTKIILVEGNYLLLKDPPWNQLHTIFDITIMLTCPQNIIIERLRQRWIKHDYSTGQIKEKMNNNDLPNVDTVLTHSTNADYEISTANEEH